MSVELTSEQKEFQSTLRNFFAEHADFKYLAKRTEEKVTRDTKIWQKFEELGLFEYFSSQDPEASASAIDLGILSFEIGYSLYDDNLLETILAQFSLARLTSGEFLKQAFQSNLQSKSFVLASTELAQIKKDKDKKAEVQLSVELNLVHACSLSDYLIVQIGSERSPETYLVDVQKLKASAIVIDVQSIQLNQFAQSVKLENAPAQLLKEFDSSHFSNFHALAIASEIAGITARCIEITKEYVKTRKQFGVPIGGFQAVQHQLVDAHLKSESLRTLATFASWSADNSPEQLSYSAKAALFYALDVASGIVETCIQLHGGIGFTWEYELHLFLRRVKFYESCFAGEQKILKCREILNSV